VWPSWSATAWWRVLLLGLHPVEDAASPGRGAPGGPRGAGRRRGGERSGGRPGRRLCLARLHGLRLRRLRPGLLGRTVGNRRHPRRGAHRRPGHSRGGGDDLLRRPHRDRDGVRPHPAPDPRPVRARRRLDEPRGDGPRRGARGAAGARRCPPTAWSSASVSNPPPRCGGRTASSCSSSPNATSCAATACWWPSAGARASTTSVSRTWASSRAGAASKSTRACAPATASGRPGTPAALAAHIRREVPGPARELMPWRCPRFA
jgi:hypothetical protein